LEEGLLKAYAEFMELELQKNNESKV